MIWTPTLIVQKLVTFKATHKCITRAAWRTIKLTLGAKGSSLRRASTDDVRCIRVRDSLTLLLSAQSSLGSARMKLPGPTIITLTLYRSDSPAPPSLPLFTTTRVMFRSPMRAWHASAIPPWKLYSFRIGCHSSILITSRRTSSLKWKSGQRKPWITWALWSHGGSKLKTRLCLLRRLYQWDQKLALSLTVIILATTTRPIRVCSPTHPHSSVVWINSER